MNTSPAKILLTYVKLTGPKASKILRMVIDTGATHTMVSVEKLIAIGYDPARAKERLEITTANGVIIAPVIAIKSLESLGIKVSPLKVIGHNLPEPSPAEGLLGLDFLVHVPSFRKFLSDVRSHIF